MKFPVISTEQDFEEYYKSDIWLEAAKQICERHAISSSELKRADYSALRLKPEAVNFSFEELERAIWNFAESKYG